MSGLCMTKWKPWPHRPHLPLGKQKLQSFLGLANYYRCCVPHFASTMLPLTERLKGGGKGSKLVTLRPDTLQAFHSIKQALCHRTVLHTPIPNQPFLLHTDAYSTGLRAVLAQDTPQGERPIIYLSRKLSSAERKYALKRRPWQSTGP